MSIRPPSAPSPRKPAILSDRAAIVDLVARFDDAVNRRDADEFGALWAEEAIWEIGDPQPLHVEGREAIIETWRRMIAGTDWLFRGSFMGVIGVEGDTGWGRWPCVETGTFTATADSAARGYDNRAIYEDLYVRQDGHWRFRHRRYLYLWLSSENLPGGRIALGEEIASD